MAAKLNVENFSIWQWNCWGFLQKRAVLQQFLRSRVDKPQVILLQETLTDRVTLQGYTSHVVKSAEGRGICTLVAKKYTFIEHDLHMGHSTIEHSFVEIIPSGGLRNSIFLLHIYSSPKGRHHRFYTILSKAVSVARKARAPIVVAGDFNAPHHAWGYPRTGPKGADLWQTASDLNLTLVTDPAFPTRTGNSCSRDSTPDLTFVGSEGKFRGLISALIWAVITAYSVRLSNYKANPQGVHFHGLGSLS